MDESFSPFRCGKRRRLDDTVNPLTSSMSTFQPNSVAFIDLWKSEYEKKSQEKWALEAEHTELRSKFEELEDKTNVLQQKNEELRKALGDLQFLCNNQISHISQLPHEGGITRLDETIEGMEAATKRYIKKITEVEKQRDDYKAMVAECEKEKKDIEDKLNFQIQSYTELQEQMQSLKNGYENGVVRLHLNNDALDLNEKDLDQIIHHLTKQREADKAKIAELEKKAEAERKTHEKEKKTLEDKVAAEQYKNALKNTNEHKMTPSNQSLAKLQAKIASLKKKNEDDRRAFDEEMKGFKIKVVDCEMKRGVDYRAKEQENIMLKSKIAEMEQIIDDLHSTTCVDTVRC